VEKTLMRVEKASICEFGEGRGGSVEDVGCNGCEVPGDFDCQYGQLIYCGVAHARIQRGPVNDPRTASIRARVAMTKVREAGRKRFAYCSARERD
jgi:hypothetical protein